MPQAENPPSPSPSPSPAPAPAPATSGATVVLFDGVCNLCNEAVQFLLRRDRRHRLRFAALQAAAGQALLRQHGMATDTLETVVVLDNGRARVRSDAAILLARRLPWPWPLLAIFLVCPRPLRDALYAFVARHRYRWFGRRETCMLPSPELADRFLD